MIIIRANDVPILLLIKPYQSYTIWTLIKALLYPIFIALKKEYSGLCPISIYDTNLFFPLIH